MVASGEDLRGESSEGREDAQSGAQSFPIVCRRNWGDSILVAVDAGDGACRHWKDVGDGLGKKREGWNGYDFVCIEAYCKIVIFYNCVSMR